MTIKYTTVRLQRKEALLGYTVPKGALFIRGNGLQFICTERPKDPFDIPVMMFQNEDICVCHVLILSKRDSKFYLKEESAMNNVYTIQEIMTLKFCELSNVVYEAILAELTRQYKDMIDRLLPIFDKAPVYQLDQYVDIYKFIVVI